MADSTYREWMDRGREHRLAGRALDALVCFRRAARVQPSAAQPHFGIGLAFWQLGRPLDALAAWRQASKRNAKHPQTWVAQADAALFVGDYAQARSATEEGLRLAPDNERLALIAALLAQPLEVAPIVERVAASPALLAEKHLSRAMAHVLRRLHDDASRPVLVEALLPLAPSLEASALAQLGAEVPGHAIEAVLQQPAAPAELDALRQLACALAVQGPQRAALAEAARARYAQASLALHAPQIPLLWPLRTGEPQLRVLLLTDGTRPALLADVLATLGAHQPTADFALLAAVAEPEADDSAERVELAATTIRKALDITPFASTVIARMPAYPDSESARAIAVRDADVLVDIAGLHAASGVLLAQRPARALWSIAPAAGEPGIPVPLVDRVLGNAGSALAEALAQAQQMVDAAPPRATVAQLSARVDAAVLANQSEAHAAARQGYDLLLAEQPGHAPTHYLRGTLARDQGEDAAALADFMAAVQAAPRDAKSWAAAVHLELKRYNTLAARALVDQALAAVPDDVGLLRAYGHVALEERDGPGALNAFARAVSLEPLNAETHYHYGVALQMLHFRAEAARAYQRALALVPDMAAAHFNLAILFHEQGDIDAAVQALEFVLARNPRRSDAHRTLVNILDTAQRHAEWGKAVLRFEQQCPDALGLVAPALEYYQYQGDFKTVERYLQRVVEEKFKPADELDFVDSLEQLLYLLLFFDAPQGLHAGLYRTYSQVALRVYGKPHAWTLPRAPGRLRVGYLSADLRDHVMGKMLVDALAQHDHEVFEVFFYSTSPPAEDDAITARYRTSGDHFESLHGMSDAEAAARIVADDLDLLVDLSTHTKGARAGIVARKPARVQLTHVASAGAMGLAAVDFKLTDRLADRPENAADYVETLLPMEGCVYPFRRMVAAPVHPYHRDRLGIAADATIIGAFVTPLKLSRRTLALWKSVLDSVPGARLAFSPNAPWMRDAYPRLLAAAGIDAGRILWLPQGRDEAERLARYAVVDFVLDPMPFGNVNGTLEPLNMHVPVVTLCGQSHGERTGFSLLSALGLTKTIAQSGRDYVAIAVRLATDAHFMRAVRGEIAAAIESPRTAAHAYTRNLEAAYLQALDIAHHGAAVNWRDADAHADA